MGVSFFVFLHPPNGWNQFLRIPLSKDKSVQRNTRVNFQKRPTHEAFWSLVFDRFYATAAQHKPYNAKDTSVS